MATEIRQLRDDELPNYVRIGKAAFPGVTMSDAELLERMRAAIDERDPASTFHGAFRAGELVGVMRFFDFTLAYHGVKVPLGGVGFLAVDLLHKREHVARDLVAAFLRSYRAAGAPLAALYPFRPDFYQKMGFGFGTKISAYRLATDAFPAGGRAHLRHLSPDDAPAVLACHNRYVDQTHGLFVRGAGLMRRVLVAPDRRAVGYVADGELQGYLVYQFQRGATFIDNALEIVELVYEHPAALRELCAFVHAQADQVGRTLWNTHDDQVHHLFADPRNGSGNLLNPISHETNTQGVGMMYRLIDTAGFFRSVAAHRFGGESLALAFDVRDSFLAENHGTTVVRFEQGAATVDPGATPDATLSIGVGHLSSVLMGSADLGTLLRYGLAEIAEPGYSGTVLRLLRSETRPHCLTVF